MKIYPPAKPAHHPRVPAFSPVPSRGRADGWTPRRQAAFLAELAITRSVSKAARKVRMARETAYRLRSRPGAESFAAAWDKVTGRGFGQKPKVTAEERARRAISGLLKPVIYQGRHVATTEKADTSALLGHLAQLDRRLGEPGRGGGRSQGLGGVSGSLSPRPTGHRTSAARHSLGSCSVIAVAAGSPLRGPAAGHR